MKKGAIATVAGVMVFGLVLALGVAGLALVGKMANGRQQVQVEQARAETAKAESAIAHEQRLEAEVQPEIIQENWEGLTQHLLVVGQVERDREITHALIRLATAELNQRERAQTFGYVVMALVVIFLLALRWWTAAREVLGNG